MGGLASNGEGLATHETSSFGREQKGALRKNHQAFGADLGFGNSLPVLPPVLKDTEYSRIRDREDKAFQ